jgi:hypothetical protein
MWIMSMTDLLTVFLILSGLLNFFFLFLILYQQSRVDRVLAEINHLKAMNQAVKILESGNALLDQLRSYRKEVQEKP